MAYDVKKVNELISVLKELTEIMKILNEVESGVDFQRIKIETVGATNHIFGISIPANAKNGAFISTIKTGLQQEKQRLEDEFIQKAKEAIPFFEHRGMETTSAPRWIYDDPYEFDAPIFTPEFWEDLEKALGFKLFYWQKTMITRGKYRGYGQTTAKILRDLLIGCLSDPVVLQLYKNQDRLNDRYVKIHDQLVAAGIPCRDIIFEPNDSEG